MTGQEKINTLKNYNNIDKLKRIEEYLRADEDEMYKLWHEIKKKEKEGKPNLDNYLKEAFNESKVIDIAINRKGF